MVERSPVKRRMDVRIILFPQNQCECDEVGGSWRSVKPFPSGEISSNLITHTEYNPES